MRGEVVGLDVIQVNGLLYGGHLVQFLGVLPERWVLIDEAFVRLEVHHVNLHHVERQLA